VVKSSAPTTDDFTTYQFRKRRVFGLFLQDAIKSDLTLFGTTKSFLLHTEMREDIRQSKILPVPHASQPYTILNYQSRLDRQPTIS